MKVSMSEQTARKVLDVLDAIPNGTDDQDLAQLRDRVQQNLKSVTSAGALNPAELQALHLLVLAEMQVPKHWHASDKSARPLLGTILAKLEALRDRRRFEAAGG